MRNLSELLLGIVLILVGLITPTICVVKGIKFDQQCKGYLKQTADANTVELAIERLDKAIYYIEENKLTDGYTSILYKTEDENIGFWYENILACRKELEDAKNSSQFEKTNVLMKVRESLTDSYDGETTITVPSGISRYPDNLMFALFGIGGFILCVFGIFLFVNYLNEF